MKTKKLRLLLLRWCQLGLNFDILWDIVNTWNRLSFLRNEYTFACVEIILYMLYYTCRILHRYREKESLLRNLLHVSFVTCWLPALVPNHQPEWSTSLPLLCFASILSAAVWLIENLLNYFLICSGNAKEKQAFAGLMSLSRSWSTSSCRRKDALIASADIPAITSPDLRASNLTIIEDHWLDPVSRLLWTRRCQLEQSSF